MKKTLLIAAAALVAGIISTTAQAQNVYSQNVVGYANITIPPNGYQIVGSQFINGSDANATNGDINATFSNGFISQPIDPPNTHSNSAIYIYNGVSFVTYYYFNAADANTWNGTPVAGWYDLLGNYANVQLTGNQAAFIQNHSSSPMTITTVGNIFQGTNVSVINAGYNFIALQVPISTNPIVSGYGLPSNMTSSPVDPPLQSRNDAIFVWNGINYQTYYYFNAADSITWGSNDGLPGFHDTLGDPMPVSAYPQVNQGFFLYHTGAPITWTNAFVVQ
jgi:hypothetical protein